MFVEIIIDDLANGGMTVQEARVSVCLFRRRLKNLVFCDLVVLGFRPPLEATQFFDTLLIVRALRLFGNGIELLAWSRGGRWPGCLRCIFGLDCLTALLPLKNFVAGVDDREHLLQ